MKRSPLAASLLLLCLILAPAALAQSAGKPPLDKRALLTALDEVHQLPKGERPAAFREYNEIVRRRGVGFWLTPEDLAEFARHEAPEELIDAVDESYRPVGACAESPGSERRPISGGVLNGKVLVKPDPVYPEMAKAARASGAVNVSVVVGRNGRVSSASALSGHPLLKQAAMEAARKARFSPVLLSGCPVRVSGILTYNFSPD